MTWTYDPTLLATTTRYQVRLLIGDTDTTDQQLQDEEIDYYITLVSDAVSAAIECAEALAAKFAREADTKQGQVSEQCSQRAKAYADLAERLKVKLTMGVLTAMTPYAGGISEADKDIDEQDSDRVTPFFSRDGMDIDGQDIGEDD